LPYNPASRATDQTRPNAPLRKRISLAVSSTSIVGWLRLTTAEHSSIGPIERRIAGYPIDVVSVNQHAAAFRILTAAWIRNGATPHRQPITTNVPSMAGILRYRDRSRYIAPIG
jgi:hypothetical protein